MSLYRTFCGCGADHRRRTCRGQHLLGRVPPDALSPVDRFPDDRLRRSGWPLGISHHGAHGDARRHHRPL